MKIEGEYLRLNQSEAAAWGVEEAAIPLAQIAFGGLHCPVERTEALRQRIAAEQRDGLRFWPIAGFLAIDPMAHSVSSLGMAIETVEQSACLVLVHELEESMGIPHAPAPEVTYRRRRRRRPE